MPKSKSSGLRTAAEAHYDDVYRFAYSLARTESDALDLTQNAFLKLAKRFSQIRDRSRLRSWLFTTVRREFIDQKRRNTRFPEVEWKPEVQNELAGREISPENAADGTLLLQEMLRLEEPFREALALHYLKQLTYREMASILEIPIGTVMSRLARARQKLKNQIERGRNQGEPA